MTDDRMVDISKPLKEAGSLMGTVASDIKSAASHSLDKAVTEVRAQADEAKTDVANEVKSVATALRRASEELRGGSAQERTLGTIASGMADASDAIRDKDLGELVQMISKIARENPVLFLGGAALLGFAASRYAKASDGQSRLMLSNRATEQKAQVAAFVDEGNPNNDDFRATP